MMTSALRVMSVAVLGVLVLVLAQGPGEAEASEEVPLDEYERATLYRLACNERTAGRPVGQALVERLGLHVARLMADPDPHREQSRGLLGDLRGERCPEPKRVIAFRTGELGEVDGDPTEFRRLVRNALTDPRGWSLDGDLRFVVEEEDAQFNVWLASPAEVDAAHEVCSPGYSCRVGDDIYINDARWHDPPETFASEPLDAYRRYVVNHEVGHWLGYGHFDCEEAGEPAPVMQQQSIDLQGCEANVWPLGWEREGVREEWIP